jgi:hypothetical protein
MRDEHPHLREVLRTTQPQAAEPEEEVGLPTLRDGDYQAHALPSNKPLSAIHFVSPKGDVRSFQYVDLDSDSRFMPECITLRFTGMDVLQVQIQGRNLWRLYDYIHQNRMRWVRESAHDLAKDGQPLVTRVAISLVKDEGRGR